MTEPMVYVGEAIINNQQIKYNVIAQSGHCYEEKQLAQWIENGGVGVWAPLQSGWSGKAFLYL